MRTQEILPFNIEKLLHIFTRKEKRRFLRLSMAIFVVAIFEVVGIASILPFLQLMANPELITENSTLNWFYTTLGFTSARRMLVAMGVMVLILITVSNLVTTLTIWFQYKYSWAAAHSLGLRLLRVYLRKPYAYFLDKNTTELRAYLISEVGALTTGVLIPLIEMVSRLLVSLLIFALLVWVDVKIAVIMLGALGLSYLMIYKSRQRTLKKLGEERIGSNLDRYQSLAELLMGIKTVKAYDAQDFFYRRYAEASLRFSNVQPRFNFTLSVPRYALEVLAFGGILIATLYLYLRMGDIGRILPVLTLYAVAGYRLLPALQKVFTSAAKFKHNLPVLDKLYDDLVQGIKIDTAKQGSADSLPFTDKLSLENVSFQYENASEEVLANAQLTIQKGQVVAFVGTTGTGKTTLIDLIVGLLKPTKGALRIDDILLSEENITAWQNQIAYVPQDVFLFDDSIAANIVIGQPNEQIDRARLETACRMAGIYSFVAESLPYGFDTEVGEQGVRLSGGQRQRLGLARALYRQPSVLILDEATNALDSITERGVIESLKALPDDLTILIIAHRLSTVRYADRIYLLDGGKVAASGTYGDLMETNVQFQKMVETSQ